MAKIHAYLNFNGNCAEAFSFYEGVFNTKNVGIYKMGDMPPMEGAPAIPDSAKEKVMHTALFINETTMIMGSDVVPEFGHQYQAGNNVYVMLDTETAEEAKSIYEKLSVNAQRMEMPLGEQFWAELYASFADQFGINWMIHFEGNKAQKCEDE
ncbi:VOC family protein [Faecalibacter macacae]|uniref:VOC family protein n=1 Tax=Faecalibacter macacae TaxID=1859289 RepID=A0A3L9MCH7_9FLAO|nr:VOC family protein [Faecalibacter macacae]RLZ10745.1 VOC family protein [Faecalibacter macacae]